MASSLFVSRSMCGRLARRRASSFSRSSSRAVFQASATVLAPAAVPSAPFALQRPIARTSRMKEKAARAIRMSPRQANPTRNEPIVEKSDRPSSPKSSPTSPEALCPPNASCPGQPTWMSAAAMMTISTSPARRAGVAAFGLPVKNGMLSSSSSSGTVHATQPTSVTSPRAHDSPTGPTQSAPCGGLRRSRTRRRRRRRGPKPAPPRTMRARGRERRPSCRGGGRPPRGRAPWDHACGCSWASRSRAPASARALRGAKRGNAMPTLSYPPQYGGLRGRSTFGKGLQTLGDPLRSA